VVAERIQRRLAAILAADVVGYSRLMQADEAGTLVALKSRRVEVLQPLVSQHRGRIIKLMGDGVLVEFASAVDAVECAMKLQDAMRAANAGLPTERQILLRIGINLGDVIVEGGDLYGDGVNIAARIEGLSDPGGVHVSQAVVDHVRGKVAIGFEDLGEKQLKNMPRPVRVYRAAAAASATAEPRQADLAGKVSVAVLPFGNISGDPEQEYFSDGITEDIITDLSKVSTIKVISRNTVFTYKGKAVEIGKVAKELNLSHVVEGSVRKSGPRVRITAQLIDSNDRHVWAERYDRELTDIFALQDEISQAIVSALRVKLQPEEKRAIVTRSTHNSDAYELYLLARYHFQQRGAKELEQALRLCQRSLEIDPNYARAWALTAICQAFLYIRGWQKQSGLSAAKRALALDPTLAEAHAARGAALAELGRFEEARAAHEEALHLDPESFEVRYYFGRASFQSGRYKTAIEHFERASQLLETDYFALGLVTQSYEALGQRDEAMRVARRQLERIEGELARRPDNVHAVVQGACVWAFLGEREQAKNWARRATAIGMEDPIDYYNLGCMLALIEEVEQALEVLESSVPKLSAEFVDWIRTDTDLRALHGHPRYQALIAQAEARLTELRSERALEQQ
jgi:adenylate cyclase